MHDALTGRIPPASTALLKDVSGCPSAPMSPADTFNVMARKIIHQLVDDLDGEVLEAGSGETVAFSIGSTSYEIDLSEKNASEFREKFEPWISAARRVSGAGSGRARRHSQQSGKRDLAAIRSWANANGHQVSERGRVSESVLQVYEKTH